ncbi:MAG: EAL domain-containing protein [Actinomycetota bacterium]
MVSGEENAVPVLLVEDNPGDARLVEILLEEARVTGFEVVRAERLLEALELLERRAFDVVLLDLTLPDSSGLETVDRMRAAVPQIPLVVLSGRDDEETALRAIKVGAEDYLVKGQGDGDLIARSIRYAIERKRAEQRMAYLAQYDHLTGLANRALFQDRLEQALARAGRSSGRVALMFVDLDRFKVINDTFGHMGGDELLREVAARIRGRLRESDTVARLGGDEFAIILENLAEAHDAAQVARDLLEIISEPVSVGGHEVSMTASIGIAVHPPSGLEDILMDADTAMYRAKERGRNHYEFYTEEMNVRAFERLTLENGLRQAQRRGEFLLHYQPQVDLRTGYVVGVEALLRWQHPQMGLVPPGRFIPLLEETGMISDVGRWVIEAACRQAKVWSEQGLPALRVAVNLSARQFGRHQDLPGLVAGALAKTGLEPALLELEVTESLLMEDIEATSRLLRELKHHVEGVRVSIDDFGTGYSSLYYLKSLPIDVLKIDRSFVRDVPVDPDDAAITAAVIGLAHNLRLEVVAEGVETAEQLSFLRERDCDLAQGYHLSAPLPAEEVVRLLEGGAALLTG